MLGIESGSNRILGLDILRVLAIIFVVHGHGAFLLEDTIVSSLLEFQFPYGVEIFFVLTGFLIGGRFISYSDNCKHLGADKIVRFYTKTALRILPCYIFMLLVNYYFVQYHVISGDTEKFSMFYFITLTQNIFTPFYDFYWESWCLPVQWWFYILFPLFIVAITRFSNLKKTLPWICVVFILLSMAYRLIIFEHANDNFWWDVWVRKTVASRTDSIYVGVLASWINYYHPKWWKNHATISGVIGMFIMAMVCIVPYNIGTVYSNVCLMTIPPIAIALWLPFLSKIRTCKEPLLKIVTDISVLSYAMYLTNMLLCKIIGANFAEHFHNLGLMGYIIYWLAVLITSYMLYIIVEKPFDKIKQKFV